jgi:uncharacterized protein YndB with AHSA1/START domain
VNEIRRAARANVFSVWTDPQLIPDLWGDGTVVEEMDVRPGGTYRFRTAHGLSRASSARLREFRVSAYRDLDPFRLTAAG